MILEFFYTAPSCGQPDRRPSVLADVHYLYFALILLALTCLVIVAVSLGSAPIPKEHLYRLTWWSRYNLEPRIDLTTLAPDPAYSISFGTEQLQQPTWKRVLMWLCGLTGPTPQSDLPSTENNDLNFLHEKPVWRKVCNFNALLLLAFNVFLWGYFA
ncbi:hypothetical protein ILYODFUR_026120 [Ilyodon furcidens]|uniref:Sodium/glucose cotransporter 4 n=1 Tax=Ilyodon furcidens TaxID=33524 RepID=A0ABV0TXT8_9TELE